MKIRYIFLAVTVYACMLAGEVAAESKSAPPAPEESIDLPPVALPVINQPRTPTEIPPPLPTTIQKKEGISLGDIAMPKISPSGEVTYDNEPPAIVAPPPLPSPPTPPQPVELSGDKDAKSQDKGEPGFSTLKDVDKYLRGEIDRSGTPNVVPPTDFDYTSASDQPADEVKKTTTKSKSKTAKKEQKNFIQASSQVAAGLFTVISRNDLKGVSAYLESNIDPNTRDLDGDSALCYSIRNNLNDIALMLISYGADPDLPCRDGVNPIFLALSIQNQSVASTLLDAGAGRKLTAPDGSSLLVSSIKSGMEALAMQIASEKDTSFKADSSGKTPLHYAAMAGMSELVSMLTGKSVLKSKGKNKQNDKTSMINIQDINGYTPLMLAAYNGHADIVRILLNRKADTQVQDSIGRTAAYIAALAGHQEIAGMLGGNEVVTH